MLLKTPLPTSEEHRKELRCLITETQRIAKQWIILGELLNEHATCLAALLDVHSNDEQLPE